MSREGLIKSLKGSTENAHLYATPKGAAAITRHVRRKTGKKLKWRRITREQIP